MGHTVRVIQVVGDKHFHIPMSRAWDDQENTKEVASMYGKHKVRCWADLGEDSVYFGVLA